MVCDFKRIFIWHFCCGEMSITYVSLSVAINQWRPSDLHQFKKENVENCLNSSGIPSSFVYQVFFKRHYCVSSQHSAAHTSSLWLQFEHFTTVSQTMRNILNKQNIIAVTGIQLQKVGLKFCWQWEPSYDAHYTILEFYANPPKFKPLQYFCVFKTTNFVFTFERFLQHSRFSLKIFFMDNNEMQYFFFTRSSKI